MADEQDKGASTATATADAGAAPGKDAPKTSYTADDLQREADRRVSEAQRKWKEQLDATVADKTRDAEAKLAELTATAQAAQEYASFIETATGAGIRNVKAAYKVAKDDYINKAGTFDVKKFRADNPEFFAPAPNANAGAGAGAATPSNDVSAFIRAAAGFG